MSQFDSMKLFCSFLKSRFALPSRFCHTFDFEMNFKIFQFFNYELLWPSLTIFIQTWRVFEAKRFHNCCQVVTMGLIFLQLLINFKFTNNIELVWALNFVTSIIVSAGSICLLYTYFLYSRSHFPTLSVMIAKFK